MMIEMSGTFIENVKIQCLRSLLFGKAIRKFKTLCDWIRNMTITHLIQVLLGLHKYSPTVNVLSKKLHDTPWNEENTLTKSEALHCSYGQTQ